MVKYLMETFGQKLKRLRTDAGLSQAKLAELAGVNQKAISFWESDEKEPKLSSLRKLCEALGVSCEVFVNEE